MTVAPNLCVGPRRCELAHLLVQPLASKLALLCASMALECCGMGEPESWKRQETTFCIVQLVVTAVRGRIPQEQRERMFEIASSQAERLEKLTNDFLSYARPQALTSQKLVIHTSTDVVRHLLS